MRTQLPFALLATALTCSPFGNPAHAAARDRVFVASYGSDSNPCTFGSPCKTFQQAVNVVAAGGEVTAIDSAGFGPINITKPVTITSPDGVEAGIVPNPGSPAISINTTGDVFLRGLTIEGNDSGTDGITLSSAATLGIIRCVIRHFTHDGIYLQPTDSLKLSILETVASNNGNDGIDLSPSGSSAGLFGVIDHTTASSNAVDGINVWGANSFPNSINPVNLLFITIINSVVSTNGANGVKAHSAQSTIPLFVMVRDTAASANGNDGFFFDAGDYGFATMALGHSMAVANINHGAENNSSSTFSTYNDNNVGFNIGGDTSGTLSVTSFH